MGVFWAHFYSVTKLRPTSHLDFWYSFSPVSIETHSDTFVTTKKLAEIPTYMLTIDDNFLPVNRRDNMTTKYDASPSNPE